MFIQSGGGEQKLQTAGFLWQCNPPPPESTLPPCFHFLLTLHPGERGVAENSKLESSSVTLGDVPHPPTPTPTPPQNLKVGFRLGVTLDDVPPWKIKSRNQR